MQSALTSGCYQILLSTISKPISQYYGFSFFLLNMRIRLGAILQQLVAGMTVKTCFSELLRLLQLCCKSC